MGSKACSDQVFLLAGPCCRSTKTAAQYRYIPDRKGAWADHENIEVSAWSEYIYIYML